jgi:AcrR family transcriptional regulator
MSRRLPVDERRAQLLELGLELFSARPYDAISIDEIAEGAGVSKGLLYHYFGGKKAFYVATVDLAAERLIAAVQPATALPRAERAVVGLEAYFDFVLARASAFASLLRGGLGVDPEVEAIVDRTRGAIADLVLDGAGVTEPSPAFRVAARAWVGAVEAASLQWIEHPEPARPQLVGMLVVALAALLTQAAMLDPKAAASLDLAALTGALGALRGR